MKSIRLQLLVTLVATLVAAGFLLHRGPPPQSDVSVSVLEFDVQQVERCFKWGRNPNAFFEVEVHETGVPSQKHQMTLFDLLSLDIDAVGCGTVLNAENPDEMVALLRRYGVKTAYDLGAESPLFKEAAPKE